MDVSAIGIGVGLGIGLATLGVGVGLGLTSYSGLSSMARQPESAGRISTSMLIGLAFVELALLVTFVLLFLMSNKLPNYEEARTKGQLFSAPQATSTQSSPTS
jgi:F-type H+-transporting ATPase subunit c